jgi:uncharacterized membrane protein
VVLPASAKESPFQPWLPAALLAAVLYPAVGIGFAFLDSFAGASRVRFWRLAAWLVSAIVFGAHLVYEQRRNFSALRTASHVSIAVALGAFVLAVWVLVHGRVSNAPQSALAPLALVLFPLLTWLPAFVIALVAVGLVSKLRRK